MAKDTGKRVRREMVSSLYGKVACLRVAKGISKMDKRYFSHTVIMKRGRPVVLRARPKRK